MKIRKHLQKLKELLKLEEAKRAVGRNRTKMFHKSQVKAERQANAAHERADALLQQGHPARAGRKAQKALRLEAAAARRYAKSVYWRNVARTASQKIHKIDTSIKAVKLELKKFEASHGPRVDPNSRKVVGSADAGERAIYAALMAWHECAAGHRPNYYSMTGGGFNCTHCVARGNQERIGQVPYERSDCSLFVTEVCWAAGLQDPNGSDWGSGYTGTLVGQHSGWKLVSEPTMRAKGWGYVVYGGGVGHHTEFYVGKGGSMTVGHGSAPVDPGTIALFGDSDYRCYIYDPA